MIGSTEKHAGRILLALLITTGLAGAQERKSPSPLEELPPYIQRVTQFGQRADWSRGGKRILFIEKTFGWRWTARGGTSE